MPFICVFARAYILRAQSEQRSICICSQFQNVQHIPIHTLSHPHHEQLLFTVLSCVIFYATAFSIPFATFELNFCSYTRFDFGSFTHRYRHLDCTYNAYANKITKRMKSRKKREKKLKKAPKKTFIASVATVATGIIPFYSIRNEINGLIKCAHRTVWQCIATRWTALLSAMKHSHMD